MRKLAISILIVGMVATILVAGGCTAKSAPIPSSPQSPPKTLDIGMATPLSGPQALAGTQMQNAVLLAVSDQNEQGGVNIAGQKYTLNAVVRDTKFDVIVSKSVAEELVFEKGVKVIAGPFIADTVGVQSITEPNKVILFAAIAFMPSVTGPNRPYSFFFAWPPQQQFAGTFAYVQKFYPEVKTVVSMTPDMADVPLFMGAAKDMAPKYGLDWLGVEKFPLDTKDFMPVISRVMAKKPDAIDTGSTGGSMVGLCGLLIKQLRETGFDGPILMPTSTQIQAFQEVVPAKYLNRVVINGMDPGSPVASDAYRSFYDKYQKKFDLAPGAIAALLYNPLKGFFGFLNSQNTMDSTAWMQGYATYRWQGLFGFENYWVGKPILGIDRCIFGPSWVGEWTDGKLNLKWTAPLPYDIFVEK